MSRHVLGSSAVDRLVQLDTLIIEHVFDGREPLPELPDELPAAAISANDRLHWAKLTGLDLELIDRRIDTICEAITPQPKHWAVPRYRLKGAK